MAKAVSEGNACGVSVACSRAHFMADTQAAQFLTQGLYTLCCHMNWQAGGINIFTCSICSTSHSRKLINVCIHITSASAQLSALLTWFSALLFEQQLALCVDGTCFAVPSKVQPIMETVAGGTAPSAQTYQPHWSPLTWWQPWLLPIPTILAAVAGACPTDALILHCISSKR